jgi:Ca2+/Na+ antiporter
MDVDEKQLIGPSISMLLSVVILLLTLNRSKWKLNKQTGTVFLMSYIAFLVYVLAFDEEE